MSSPQETQEAKPRVASSPTERNQGFLEPFLDATVDEEPLAVLMLSPHALRIKARNKARRILLGSEEKSLRDALEGEMRKPVRIMLRDKLSFTMGVLNTAITVFLLGRYPQHFWMWYTATAVPLLLWRYVSYSRLYYQYFLLDFCYLANALCFVHLFLLPRSSTLFLITFASVSGPVASAILAWRNSLVFHSVEKMTSLFIHFMPAALVWAQRWHFDGAEKQHGSVVVLPAYLVCPEKVGSSVSHQVFQAACTSQSCPSNLVTQDTSSGAGLASATTAASALCPRSFWSAMMWPLAFYCFWQAAYFISTEVLHKHRLDRDPRLQTSLRWLARSAKGFLHDLAHSVVVHLGLLKSDQPFDPSTTLTKVVFMIVQLLYTLVTLLPTVFMFSSYWFHCFVLVLYGTAATWNGSSYYIQVFAARYMREIEGAITTAAAKQATNITKAVESALVEEAKAKEKERIGGLSTRSVGASAAGHAASPAHFATDKAPGDASISAQPAPSTTTATASASTFAPAFKPLDIAMPVPVFRAKLVADIAGEGEDSASEEDGRDGPSLMQRVESGGSLASMASGPAGEGASGGRANAAQPAPEDANRQQQQQQQSWSQPAPEPSRLRSGSLFSSLVDDLTSMLQGPGYEQSKEEAAALAAVRALAEAQKQKRRHATEQSPQPHMDAASALSTSSDAPNNAGSASS